ncbi:hypothetical protein LNV23_07030 [Paucibacter sp. DJ1R-11]|uniref:hypothetical protein n=1 Tax=Paucibacter sp. DJ1R-11 TaxID=2893556 RepID=UPI0021E3D7BE|nr:hypothetical protein [Paucibacter sp. DJ1R-11]MCV2363204.1 hypothetical protein [Paucibacter sp. DJ1R-11]
MAYYLLTWLVLGLLAALWSLASWAFHSLALWTVAALGSQAEGLPTLGARLSDLQLPSWLASWVPEGLLQGLAEFVDLFAPLLKGVLETMPVLGDWLSPLVWLIWGLGIFLLLLLGGGLSLLLKLMQSKAATLVPPRSLPSA